MPATLITPYKGYTKIRLIKKIEYKWEVEIIGPGSILYFYEDEFNRD